MKENKEKCTFGKKVYTEYMPVPRGSIYGQDNTSEHEHYVYKYKKCTKCGVEKEV